MDELGYLELDRRGAELLFPVFTEREEKASIAVASRRVGDQRSPNWSAPSPTPRTLGRHCGQAHLRRARHRDRLRILPAQTH